MTAIIILCLVANAVAIGYLIRGQRHTTRAISALTLANGILIQRLSQIEARKEGRS